MSLQSSLKQNSINLFLLIKNFQKPQLAKDLDHILKNDYEELSRNEIYTKNFLEVVSYIYAYEQILKQKSNSNKSLDVNLFDKDFTTKLELLRNNYVHNPSIS